MIKKLSLCLNKVDNGITFLLASASLVLGLTIGIFVFLSLSNVNTQHLTQNTAIAELSEHIANDKEQINVLVNDNQSIYKTVSTLEKSVASLSKRLEEVQQFQLDQYLKQSQEGNTQPSFDDLNNLQSQIATLQFQLKDLNQKVYELNKANITATINKQSQLNSANTSVPAVTPPKKTVVKPLMPPFSVLGIESRGGELFVSVAPSRSANLGQITLLRTGDLYRGWQLKDIRTNAAVFNVGSRQQVINVR